jgi:hypothetical protein
MARSIAWLSLVALCLSACSVNSQKDVARKAASAMTGSPETLTAVVNLTMEGKGRAYGHPVDAFSRSITFRRERWRQEMTTVGLPTAISGMDGAVAYHLSGSEGEIVKESAAVAKASRAAIYSHPLGFLLACFSGNPQLSNTRKEDGQDAVDLTVDGVVYSLYLDPATNLPARIIAKSNGKTYGSVFGAYQKVHGYTLPYEITETIDGEVVAEWTIARQFPGPDVPGLALAKK